MQTRLTTGAKKAPVHGARPGLEASEVSQNTGSLVQASGALPAQHLAAQLSGNRAAEQGEGAVGGPGEAWLPRFV